MPFHKWRSSSLGKLKVFVCEIVELEYVMKIGSNGHTLVLQSHQWLSTLVARWNPLLLLLLLSRFSRGIPWRPLDSDIRSLPGRGADVVGLQYAQAMVVLESSPVLKVKPKSRATDWFYT